MPRAKITKKKKKDYVLESLENHRLMLVLYSEIKANVKKSVSLITRSYTKCVTEKGKRRYKNKHVKYTQSIKNQIKSTLEEIISNVKHTHVRLLG